jgi:transposase-like protein
MTKKVYPKPSAPVSKQRQFTDEFRREAVQMMLDGHSTASVAQRLGISSPTLFYRWKQQPLHQSGPVAASLDEALVASLPGPRYSATTTGADRRAIVRLLIEHVELTRQGERERVGIVIHWCGEAMTRHEIRQGLRTYRSLGGMAKLRERILEPSGDGRPPIPSRQYSITMGIVWLVAAASPSTA